MRHIIGLAVLLGLIVTAATGSRASAQVPSPNPAFDFDTGNSGLERACAGGMTEACGRLAHVLLNRSGPGDAEHARNLLKSACDAGDEPSCGLLKQFQRKQ
jgi:hypothetical protein